MTYTHAATQTVWAGLTKMDLRPDILFTAPDTTTPPAELATDKHQDMNGIAATAQLGALDAHAKPSGGLRQNRQNRQNRPSLPTRISLPNSELDDEVLPSPPPTHAVLSPLPDANKLHAGHTPLIPRALSPVHDEETVDSQEQPAVECDTETHIPLEDQPLIGPLMLPTNPDEGASDHIALDVLDDVLGRVAKDQDRFSKLKDAPEPEVPTPATATATAPENIIEGLPLSRNISADSRKSTNTEVVDGVKLKTPPLNFGVPIGQV